MRRPQASDHASWQLEQRALAAPAHETVTDVIRRRGEIATAGQPILSILPDGAVKLRLYLPEAELSRISPGSPLVACCDNCPPGLTATASYVAEGPEFIPPVIYSVDSRQHLLYLVEARPTEGSGLKPGQIVDVDLRPVGP